MKKLITLVVLLGMLLSLQVSFVGAQEPDPTDAPEPTVYVVQEGDTAESIATLFGISVEDLLAANELGDAGEIEPGLELIIPPAQEPTEEATEEPTAEPTEEATEEPTAEPTEEATAEPTEEATEEPTLEPTQEATQEATQEPTAEPTEEVVEEQAPRTRDKSFGDEVDLQGTFNPGTGTSKIGVMNIDSGGSATYSVSFYGQSSGPDDEGTLAGEGPLPYRAAAYYDLATLGLAFGSGWVGSAIVASDREMFAVVDNAYTGGAYNGNDGYNGEAYEAPEAATDIFLPYATRLGKYRFTRVTIQGTQGTGKTSVSLIYKDQNGKDATCANPTNLSVRASRSVSFEPAFNCGTNTDNGSIRIQSSEPVVAVFDGAWGQQAGWKTAYSGIPATKAANTVYYPNIFRRVPDGEWVQWSNLFVQNVSGSTVRVRVSFYKTGAEKPSMQVVANIPPLSAKEFNTRFGGTGGNPSPSAFEAMGELFAGTAVVEKVSGPDNALVGVAHNFWGTYFFGGSTYTAIGANDAADTLFVPFSSRKQVGGTWTEWDKVSFMNVSGRGVQVTAKYYNSRGNVKLTIGPITVPNRSVDSINSRYGCDSNACSASDMASLGSSFEGTVVIEGSPGSKLMGIMNTLYPNRLNTFNAKAKNR